jgi:hypothetical protein
VLVAAYLLWAALAHSTTEFRYTYAPAPGRATINTQEGGTS